jgi:hypothetical protein
LVLPGLEPRFLGCPVRSPFAERPRCQIIFAVLYRKLRNRGSAVGVGTSCVLDDPVFESRYRQEFFSNTVEASSGADPVVLSGYRRVFPGIGWPRCEVLYSPLLTSLDFMVWTNNFLPLPFTQLTSADHLAGSHIAVHCLSLLR